MPTLSKCLLFLLLAQAAGARAHENEDNFETLQPLDRIGEPVASFRPVVIQLDVEPDAEGKLAAKLLDAMDGNAGFVQARLLLVAPEPISDLKLVARDGDEDVVGEIPLDGAAGVREIWTGLAPGQWISLEVRGKRQPTSTSIVIRELYQEALPATPLTLVGEDGRQLIADLTDPSLKRLSRSTARLTFARDGKLYNCTAFLIRPAAAAPRMMTNNHCIDDAPTCASAVLLFDYEKLAPVPDSNQRRCKRIVATNPMLDYTVFELDAAPLAGIHPLVLDPRPLIAMEQTVIVQHPGGLPKQLSAKDCGVVNPVVRGLGSNTDFTHGCDTLGGSSGSAILTPAGKVIGLHHLGRGGAYPDYNRGVRLDLIAKDLQQKGITP